MKSNVWDANKEKINMHCTVGKEWEKKEGVEKEEEGKREASALREGYPECEEQAKWGT